MPYADLHCHSTFSDGTSTVEELVNLAVQAGLKGLSLTDHDTVAGYPELVKQTQKTDITLLTGVEYSTFYRGHSVHILGYGFSPDHPSLCHLFERHQKRRRERNLLILEKLTKKGMPIDTSLFLTTTPPTAGRPHIAQFLVDQGFVPNIPTAFALYLGDGKSCYVAGEPLSVTETIDTLHTAGGIAVLAHPHLLHSASLVRQLLALPFDGLECHYGQFPPKENARWVAMAQRHHLLITGGSDFHGSNKPHLSLGCAGINQETFEKLVQKKIFP